MAAGRQARLWRALGIAFLLGGAAPLALGIAKLLPVSGPEAWKLGAWCAFTVLLGLAALGAGRVSAAVYDLSLRRRDWAWTILACSGMPFGVLILAMERQGSVGLAAVVQREAVMLAGVLVFCAGLAAVISEVIARHAHVLMERRVARDLRHAEVGARLVRVH